MELLLNTLKYILGSLAHNFPYLTLGIIIAAAMRVYVDPTAMRNWLVKRSNISVLGSVAFGAFTPLCACGTMAVILSMLTTALPWGAVMAFLTSSPLMSPDEFVLIAGVVNVEFAVALAIASIAIGLFSGFVSSWLERHTRFFEGQARMAEKSKVYECTACGEVAVTNAVEGDITKPKDVKRQERIACCSADIINDALSTELMGTCGCSAIAGASKRSLSERIKLKELLTECYEVGIKKILPNFAVFAGIGYFINSIVPQNFIAELFDAHNVFAVPLAALVGLPLYVSGSASVPLLKAFSSAGASGGALLAFMITGPGTSAGVMAGLGTIMRKRTIALYVGFLLVSGIVLGYAYDILS